MAEIGDNLDPRVRRTRALLQQSLERLLQQKDFHDISVQDIADAATLNRATFYDHYADKFALLECLVGSRFVDLTTRKGIAFEGCSSALRNVATAVCTYLQEMPGAEFACQRQSGQLLETAIVGVVRRMILDGLHGHPSTKGTSPELLASTVAWAIYGGAKEWVRDPKQVPPEAVGEKIGSMLAPMLDAAW